MIAIIEIDKDIERKLKLRSIETGIPVMELANKYILKGLQSENSHKNVGKIVYQLENLIDDFE
ncbi:MAG: hypothetical protein IJJ47_11475 [Methanosphaera sp.]|nr:hypothetical protein [Methanosphaera sp.]